MNKFFLKKILFPGVLTFGFVFLVFAKTDVFFSPKDDIETKLIEQINLAKTRVYAAIYMLTDKQIAQALIDAKNRGVDVQVVTDISCFESKSGKMNLLKENGISVFVFKPKGIKNKYQNELMHNKFALIDNKICTGSFNWTISANIRNQENIIFMDEESALEKKKDEESPLQKYENIFKDLKKICVYHEPKVKSSSKQDGIAYRAYQKLIDRTVNFLKSIRETLATP